MTQSTVSHDTTQGAFAFDGLDQLLEMLKQPGLPELRALVRQILARRGRRGRFVTARKLVRSRVYRLGFEVDGEPFSVIVKRFPPARAQRERSALTRWLPAAGMSRQVPSLLGAAAESEGRWIWHAYEDLGDWSLATGAMDEGRIRAAVGLIAKVHATFAGNRMLGEIRASGGDLGVGFLGACIRDARAALRAIRQPDVSLSAEQEALLDRLLSKLDELHRQVPSRTAALAHAGGVETFVHGDLWTSNVMVLPSERAGWDVKMIDWDHCGVGPLVYDLSTFLLRFEPQDRYSVLDLYRAAIEREAGWRLPSCTRLNQLFETCEYARLFNALVWPAIGAGDPSPQWAFEELAEVGQWLDATKQVLP
jgi:hypothetical protein